MAVPVCEYSRVAASIEQRRQFVIVAIASASESDANTTVPLQQWINQVASAS